MQFELEVFWRFLEYFAEPTRSAARFIGRCARRTEPVRKTNTSLPMRMPLHTGLLPLVCGLRSFSPIERSPFFSRNEISQFTSSRPSESSSTVDEYAPVIDRVATSWSVTCSSGAGSAALRMRPHWLDAPQAQS